MKIVGLVILALVAVWFFGGVILRLGGLFVICLILFSLVSGTAAEVPASTPYAVVWLLLGALMWLAGHWHFAFRQHQPKSSLADTIFASLPGWLDPLRGYRYRPPPRAARGDALTQDPLAGPQTRPSLDDHREHDVNGRTPYPDEEEEPRRGAWRQSLQGPPGPWGRRRGTH
jgi:hypothetical protein